MKKYRYIDSLRGFAILGVLFIHAGFSSSTYPKSWYHIINSGQYGVQLFFVTSAFTLFLSLHQREKTYLSTSEFFIRRFFRIAPMYYAGIIYYTFERFIGFSYLLTGVPRHPVPVDALISNIFFVHGVHPLWLNGYVPGGWSITVEMTFYLFVPFLFKKIRNIDQAILLFAGSLLLSVIIHELLANNAWFNREFFLYCFFPNQLPVFALGIITYFIVINKSFELKPRSFLLLFLAIFLSNYYPISKHITFAFSFAVLIILLSRSEYRFFVNRFTAYIGKISFSMYITHFAAIFIMLKFGLTDLVKGNPETAAVINVFVRFLFMLTIAAFASTITYYTIEVPFQRLGQKLISRLRNKRYNYFR